MSEERLTLTVDEAAQMCGVSAQGWPITPSQPARFPQCGSAGGFLYLEGACWRCWRALSPQRERG